MEFTYFFKRCHYYYSHQYSFVGYNKTNRFNIRNNIKKISHNSGLLIMYLRHVFLNLKSAVSVRSQVKNFYISFYYYYYYFLYRLLINQSIVHYHINIKMKLKYLKLKKLTITSKETVLKL